MKKLLIGISLALCALSPTVSAEKAICVMYNGAKLDTEQPPAVVDGRTLVPVRDVCDILGLDIDWNPQTQVVRICDELNIVAMQIGSRRIEINDIESELDAAPEIINGYTCVPLRAVLEPFGVQVGWDAKTKTVIITDENYDATAEIAEKKENEKEYAFYTQGDEEWEFESKGRGYCWVCSYAMVISNLTGERITPAEIAEYNLENGGASGSYMQSHFGLAERYGLKFVSALDEESPYFDRFEKERRGATYIKFETEEDVRAALSEALGRNPRGVMVRFEGYPHTLVAIRAADGKIYFNDPASETMENVEFANTCLARSFSLTDISFIQALEIKE